MEVFKVFFVLFVTKVLAEEITDDETNNRIVGGLSAYPGQFPHQVSLRMRGRHFCGGSIIDTTTILTAAHCVYGNSIISSITVVAGSNYLNSGGQTLRVNRITYHQNYNPNTITDDIAIIKLAHPISYNSQTKSISLANYEVQGNERLTLSGWGLTYYPGNNIPNDLKYIVLESIDMQKCSQYHSNQVITNKQICTLMPHGKGACKGDSGGPLINSKGVQVGVVSWGSPCARNRPDVFTRVSSYLEWINANK